MNSDILYNFIILTISSGMISLGADIVINENHPLFKKKITNEIGVNALGTSLLVGGIYLFTVKTMEITKI